MDEKYFLSELAKAQMGDAQAFSRVIDLVGERLVAYVGRLVPDTARAEDISQEVLIRAYRALPQLRQLDRFHAWLWRIAKCAVADSRRREFRRHTHFVEVVLSEEMDETIAAREEYADWDQYEHLLNRIRKEIHDLPESTRILVLRRYSENTSYDVLAHELGLTVPQVKARLNRARNRLRLRLAELLPKWKRLRHELP